MSTQVKFLKLSVAFGIGLAFFVSVPFASAQTSELWPKMVQNDTATMEQALPDFVNRDDSVVGEVHTIVHEYASSNDRLIRTKEKIEDRPAWIVTLIGSDYKNIGALYREDLMMRGQIKRLIEERDRGTSPTTQDTLDVQIIALTNMVSSTEAFVKENEDVFSLFGWLVRIL